MPAVLSLLATIAEVLTIAWPTLMSLLLTLGLLLGLCRIWVHEAGKPRGTRRPVPRVAPDSNEFA